MIDNVIAIDSAMGNLPVVGGASSNLTNFHVIGIAFWSSSTLGDCIITGASTTDWIWRSSIITAATNNGLVKATDSITFSSPLRLGAIKCPTLTAGSAWVYLA